MRRVDMFAAIAALLCAGMAVNVSIARAQTGQVTFSKDYRAHLATQLSELSQAGLHRADVAAHV